MGIWRASFSTLFSAGNFTSSIFFLFVNIFTIGFSVKALKNSNSIFILFSKIRKEQIHFYKNYFRDIASQLKASNKNKLLEIIESNNKSMRKVQDSNLTRLAN